MKKKRTYESVPVEQVRLDECLPLLMTLGCVVAVDVAKEKFVCALATATGEILKLFRFTHPIETWKFIELVRGLAAGLGGRVKVAMEPTGTYGDAVRHQLVKAEIPVWMVSPKKTHDSQELFDGVRSLHDPKSAVLIAKLCSMGLAKQWTPSADGIRQVRALVELRAHEQQQRERCLGRIEALQARHWPEFGRWLNVREGKSALRLLSEYGSPGRVRERPAEARAFLVKASRSRLSAEVLDGTIAEARTTTGVPMLNEEAALLQRLASQALDLDERIEKVDLQLANLAAHDEVFKRLASWMGTYTAAVIVTLCDPRQYANARQLEKAAGLNLREKSSGEHKGRLKITKRGPALVRQVMYLFALRVLQSSSVAHAWYVRRRGYTEDSKRSAVVALMRKLLRALFHVAQGKQFDADQLFDTRRLNLGTETNVTTAKKKQITSRRSPRSTLGRRASKRTRSATSTSAAPT